MKDFFEFTKRTEEASKKALTLAEKKFSEIDEITEYNQRKVLAAFINNRVDETDFEFPRYDSGRDEPSPRHGDDAAPRTHLDEPPCKRLAVPVDLVPRHRVGPAETFVSGCGCHIPIPP